MGSRTPTSAAGSRTELTNAQAEVVSADLAYTRAVAAYQAASNSNDRGAIDRANNDLATAITNQEQANAKLDQVKTAVPDTAAATPPTATNGDPASAKSPDGVQAGAPTEKTPTDVAAGDIRKIEDRLYFNPNDREAQAALVAAQKEYLDQFREPTPATPPVSPPATGDSTAASIAATNSAQRNVDALQKKLSDAEYINPADPELPKIRADLAAAEKARDSASNAEVKSATDNPPPTAANSDGQETAETAGISTTTTAAQPAAQPAAPVSPTTPASQSGLANQPPKSDTGVVSQTLPVTGNFTGVNFGTNVLDTYDRYTYHFTLSMISDHDADDTTVLTRIKNNSLKKIIIAESGVTVGFNLQDVEIQDIVSPNFRNRNTVTTDINLTITEPYSCTLVDKLFNAANDLGILNWRLSRMMLEIKFNGYDSEGNILNTGNNGIYKVYQLLITDFNASFTTVGTSYKITAMVSNNMAQTDWYYILNQSFTVPMDPSNASVGDFFEKFQNILNNWYLKQLADPANTDTRFVQYIFEVCPTLRKEKIDMSAYANRRRINYKPGVGNDIITSRGITIGGLVEDICSSLENHKFFTVGDAGIKKVRMPRVETLTKNIAWNLASNNYVKEITFKITIQETIRAVASKDDSVALQSNPEWQRDLFQNLLTTSLFRSYQYYYTGMNTSIINLAVDFNMLHIIELPLDTTTANPQAGSSNRVSAQKAFIQANEQIASKNREITMTPDGELPANAYIAQLSNQQQEAIARRDALVPAVLAEKGKNLILLDPSIGNQLIARGGADIQENLKKLGLNASEADVAAAKAKTNIQIQYKYAEDYKVGLPSGTKSSSTTPQTNAQYSIIESSPADISNKDSRPGNTPPADPNNPGAAQSRATNSTVMSQMYEKTLTQMLEIDLEIRGDPYWMGITNLERMLELSSDATKLGDNWGASNERQNNRSYANYHDYDSTFLLTFRTGSQPSDLDGFMHFDDSSFFNGVYMALEVTHVFSNGKFTQKIKAVRNNNINLKLIKTSGMLSSSTVNNTTQPPQASLSSNPVAALVAQSTEGPMAVSAAGAASSTTAGATAAAASQGKGVGPTNGAATAGTSIFGEQARGQAQEGLNSIAQQTNNREFAGSSPNAPPAPGLTNNVDNYNVANYTDPSAGGVLTSPYLPRTPANATTNPILQPGQTYNPPVTGYNPETGGSVVYNSVTNTISYVPK